jgi:lipopolysaccharide transport system ATP-binding protein
MIKVSQLSKTYLLWQTPLSRLLVPLVVRLLGKLFPVYCACLQQSSCQPVCALKNVSFHVPSGDSLGIIGLNGSGKSTLLQIIAGTLQPTAGHVEVSGRIAALLELGSGFDPEFTGRENIYINASILGLSRKQIDERYEAIVSFADIGEFIERPVKTYSSGMMVRLAFAVQVHVDPDVLIVDEALAVGDARFQAKALNKIEEILQQGTTLLFVGHDLNAVRSFCNKAILLNKGEVVKEGLPEDVIADYLYLVQKDRLSESGLAKKLQRSERGFELQGFSVVNAEFSGVGDHISLRFNEMVTLNVDIHCATELEAPYLIVDIVDHRGLQLSGKRLAVPDYRGVQRLKLQLRCGFQKGIYRVRLRLVDAPSIEQTLLVSRYDDILSIEMLDDVRDKFTGIFDIPMAVEWFNL